MKENMTPTITLLHGDCLELMKDIPDKSIDAIIATNRIQEAKNNKTLF